MNKPKMTRKQAEAKILSDMRNILNRVDFKKINQDNNQDNNAQESINRNHIMSVISEFKSIKKQTKH
jgi:predicted double-glycine peptidase